MMATVITQKVQTSAKVGHRLIVSLTLASKHSDVDHYGGPIVEWCHLVITLTISDMLNEAK